MSSSGHRHHRSTSSRGSGERPSARGTSGQRSPKMPDEPVEESKRISNGPNHYQLGQEIGRGGFAVVFQAFNVSTGGLAAVKRFPVNAIDKESLSSIESEIELMQKLNHPNIVKYYDTIKTKHYLYIVIEFMENGSLATVMKKFGSFSEPLASIYISQVLSGLKYLHEQGVLHRDIKAANILTSKDGLVKLADFGVAMKQSEAHADEQDVVGSSYWIAPEIIEMSAPTTACDVWSVGCVVIELLTGKPPYFDLAPMAALFRIVSDDYPPIPEGISQALRDFLLLCFQKDPYMRSSAGKLLEHPWITNSSSQTKLELTTKMLQSRSTEQKGNDAEDVVASTIRTYQRDLKPQLDEESVKSQEDRSRPSSERQKGMNNDSGSDRKRSSQRPPSMGMDSPSRSRHRRYSGPNAAHVNIENLTNEVSMEIEKTVSNDSAEDTAKFSGNALRKITQQNKPLDLSNTPPPQRIDVHSDINPPATPSAGAKGGLRSAADNILSTSNSYSANASPAISQTLDTRGHSRDLAISPETSEPPTPVGLQTAIPSGTPEIINAIDRENVSSGSSSNSSDKTPPVMNMYGRVKPHSQGDTQLELKSRSSGTAITDATVKRNNEKISAQAQSALSGSSGGSSLHPHVTHGMKAISEDFEDGENWDADFLDSELNVSPDDHDILPSNSSKTVFSILEDRHTSKARHVNQLATIPSVINLNSKSTSFTFKDSEGESARRGKAALGRSDSSDWGAEVIVEGVDAFTIDLNPLTKKKSEGLEKIDEENSSKLPKSPASTVSSSTTSPKKAQRDLRLNLRTASNYSLNRSSSSQGYDRVTSISQSPSGFFTGSHQHNHSFMLMKFQEQPEEEDFDDFEDDEENMAVLATPQLSGPAAGRPKFKKKFTVGSARSASTDTIGDDDFEDDTSPDDQAANFSDMIKNIQKGNTRPGSRPSSFRVDLGRENVLSTSIEEDNSFDNFDVDENDGAKPLAARLKQRMKRITKETVGEEVDEFINYQFDEKDFKQNEHKDEHFRRSREVVDIMMRIRSELRTKEVIHLCGQLISIFTQFPEQREHLVTYHGVMPIVDMFEARYTAQARATLTSNNRDKSLYVMRVVNKIIEGSTRTQEQLSLVGIIPTVMNLFERSYKTIGAFPTTYNNYTDCSSSTSSDATPDNSRHTHISEETSHRLPPKHQYLASDEEVDPLTLETAHFIHQISSSSSLTLQMLIGAGGLSVLTNMVSFGAYLSNAGCSPTVSSPAAIAKLGGANEKLGRSSSFSAKIKGALSKGIATAAEESNYDLVELVTDEHLSEDPLFEGRKTTNDGNNINSVASSPTTNMISNQPDDFRKRFQLFQMGIDCILEVFAVQASRTRDFCRLFVKLGLLPPLASSFQNVLNMYTSKLAHDFTQNNSMTPCSSPSDSFTSSNGSSKQHRRKQSSSSHDVTLHLDADDSIERKYANHIAMLFFKFSRSDSIVVETMVKADQGVINVIITALQAHELRYNSYPHFIHNGNTSFLQSSHGKSGSNNNNNIDSITQSLSMQNLSITGDGTNGPNLRMKSPRAATSANLLERRMRANSAYGFNNFNTFQSKSMLTPSYLEVVELMLKCLNRLSMEPSALNDMETAGTIETLIPLLGGPITDRCKSQIMQCMFYLCRINKRRQEKAANLGIVPHLKNVIIAGSPHRQFALPIIFDLAHTSNETRDELWKNDCVPFYLNLLSENYWQSFAVNSVATWLASDPIRVGGILVDSMQLPKLIEFFRTVSTQTIHSLHKPLLDMMSKSKDLARELGSSAEYVTALVKRLKSTSEAIVLRSLLRMLQLMHQQHPSPNEWIQQHNLISVVHEFAQSEGQVLIFQLANKLLIEFTETT